jgi:hypothetical protein
MTYLTTPVGPTLVCLLAASGAAAVRTPSDSARAVVARAIDALGGEAG